MNPDDNQQQTLAPSFIHIETTDWMIDLFDTCIVLSQSDQTKDIINIYKSSLVNSDTMLSSKLSTHKKKVKYIMTAWIGLNWFDGN